MINAAIGLATTQFRLLLQDQSNWLVFITGPLLTVAFVGIFLSSGRSELLPYAVIGPALMALFQVGLFVASEIVATDKSAGTIDAILAAPTPLGLIIGVRVAVVSLISLIAIPESIFVAYLVFEVTIPIEHPLLLLLTLIISLFALIFASALISGVLIFFRSARVLQNSLSYPFFLLSGVLFPIATLPMWIQSLSPYVFLTWMGVLFRGAFFGGIDPGSAVHASLSLLAISGVMLLLAVIVFRIAVRRMKQTGEFGFE